MAAYLRPERLEEALAALRAIDLSRPEGLEQFAREQARRGADGEQLAAEQAALLKEWRTDTTVGEPEREAVRALARRGDALSRELEQAYDDAGALALRTAGVVELQVNALRRGTGIARKFRPQGEDLGGFVDRQA